MSRNYFFKYMVKFKGLEFFFIPTKAIYMGARRFWEANDHQAKLQKKRFTKFWFSL